MPNKTPSNYPPGTYEGDPRAPWNQPYVPAEAAAKSKHPSAAWQAAQVYRALRDWKEENPELLEKH